MKRFLLPVPVLLAGPALLALSTPSDGPSFGPEAGSEVTKTFSSEMEFDLDDFSVVVNGQDIGAMLGDIQVNLFAQNAITVTDVYGKFADGRLQRLERTYEDLGGSFNMSFVGDMGSESQDQTSSSLLEGSTVVFEWNADDEAYDVSFEDGDGDDELLEGLEQDMDLRFLLPPGPVSEGDTWEVEVEALQALIAPGGNLSLLPEDTDMEQMSQFEELFGDRIEQDFADMFDGSCTCTYKGSHEVDGVKVGEIGIVIQVGGSADFSDLIMDFMSQLGDEFGEMPDLSFDTADLTFDYEGEGTLLWNLAAGRAQAMDISGDVDFAMDLAVSVEAEGQSFSSEVTVEISGSHDQDFTIE